MHVKYSHRLTVVICAAAFLWLGIMIALTLSDYLSRSDYPSRSPGGWIDIPGK